MVRTQKQCHKERKQTGKTLSYRMISGFLAVLLLFFAVPMPERVRAVTKEESQRWLKGIDISSFNGDVDLGKVKSQGYDYVMIRTGSGQKTADPNFAVNYGKAGAAGLKRGVYHYSYAKTVEDAKAEADACLSALDNRNLECPIAYDVEENATFATGKDSVTAMAVAFCEEVKKAGYEPMIYASLSKLIEYFDYDTISQYKIWIANYDVDYPNYPHPYYMWQHKIGSVDGANTASGQCDENYVYEQFIEADQISLDQNTLNLQLGEGLVSNAALTATIGTNDASNRHVNWSSENEKVAVVDKKGNVQALANGTVNITASTVNGVTATCKVTVTTPATGIALDSQLTIGKKETVRLKPTLTPATSTDKTTYTSSDEKIVKANSDGTLTGVKPGEVTITAVTDSGVSTTMRIKVKKAPWYISNGCWYKKMKVGDSYKMKCKLSKNAASSKITYYSRNKYRVKIAKDGTVTAVAAGWCLIRASTYNGKKTWTLVHVVR